jgi:predicted acyl esterase
VLEVPKPELARIEDFSIAARDGVTMPARLYAPSGGRAAGAGVLSTAAASRSATSARTTRCAAC